MCANYLTIIIYITFLVRDYKKAEVELNIVREISMGEGWLIKAYLPTENNSDTLFMNANYLLHLCYMRQARLFIKIDQNKALEFATLARRRAREGNIYIFNLKAIQNLIIIRIFLQRTDFFAACHRDGETMALYIKGQCELYLGDTKSAISTLNKAFYMQAALKSYKGMCEARVELSKAYLM